MSEAEQIAALADRVEGATGADRELDELVSAAISGAAREVQPNGQTAYHTKDGTRWCGVEVKPYTASLDAAMTLVDPTWFFHISRFSPESDSRGQAHIYPNRGLGDDYEADAATLALALVAAALRARTYLTKENR